jgi:hypothetical protein
MMLLGGHANEVFALAGDTLFVCATVTGLVRYRSAAWWLLCIWATFQLLASVIETLIALDYIALSGAGVWVELS